MTVALEINNLHVNIGENRILKGIDLLVKQGEIHALMGPNGSGKSTLAYTLAGHPSYEPSAGQVTFDGQDLLEMEADERSRAGLFLAFQYPVVVPGVTVAKFLRQAINSRRKAINPEDTGMPIPEFRRLLRDKMDILGIDQKFAGRYLNEGFSGGEKKRAEILQMAMLEPKIAIMDETDSGLDIDALRIVAEGAGRLHDMNNMGVLVITHYQRILNYIKADKVHIMLDGRIVESGGPELALQLEESGYDWLREKYGTAEVAEMAEQLLEREMTENEMLAGVNDNYTSKYGFSDVEDYVFKAERGLDENVIRAMSKMKGEPEWMLDYRLKAYQHFLERPMPEWGADLSGIDFDNIYYYIKPSARQEDNWEDVPSYIKDTFDKLGIPQAEQKFLSGVAAQYESEVVYHNIKKDLEDKGVIFLGMDDGLAQYPDLVKEYFNTIIPINDNKFAALNSAVWSGGSFIYVPPGVHIEMPLQAYFRINAKNVGQFERTLIIVDEGAYVHYVEGCTAPVYSSDSLHSAVVEIVVKKGGRCRYTTIQNWSNNVYNLVTKRAMAYENATMEWVDGNLGSKVTMKYPAVYLMGEGAHGEILSIAFAGKGQHQDAGGKVIHMAPHTTSRIISKSISKGGGRASYRGMMKVAEGAYDCKSNVVCDALLLDAHSRSDTYPYIEINEQDVTIGHEASVSKVGEEQVFYLMSRGIPEDEANAIIVNGFIEPLVKELPMEYAIEMNRLIQLQMEGSIG